MAHMTGHPAERSYVFRLFAAVDRRRSRIRARRRDALERRLERVIAVSDYLCFLWELSHTDDVVARLEEELRRPL